MYTDFGPILIFSLLSIVLIVVPLILQALLSPTRNKGMTKLSTYECGEEIEGEAWIQFNIRFYIVALVFLIFDVEVIMLFPWAVVFKKLGLVAFIEMLIFLFILVVGLIAVWRRGDLDWVKAAVPYGRGRYEDLLKSE